MKRLFLRYIYIIIMIPAFLILSGCNNAQTDDLVSDLNNTATGDIVNVPPPVDADTKDKPAEELINDKDLISLSSKSTVLDIDSGGRMTPFVPYRERNLSYSSVNYGDLPLPPLTGDMNEDLNNLVSAKVTGILYDAKSPSAIINVMDSDYLVKPGDKVESFKIAAITKNYVSIQTGTNVFRAKVGDIVDGEVIGTGVYNLGHRFAGRNNPARKEDILVVSTKKKEAGNGVVGFNDMSLPPLPEYKVKNNPLDLVPGAGGNLPQINLGNGGNLPKINLKTQAGEIPLPVGK